MGLLDRGVIRPEARADLVLFDPNQVLDRATPAEPEALSVGIQKVWVNGEIVYELGWTTGALPGQVIRRAPPPKLQLGEHPRVNRSASRDRKQAGGDSALPPG
jgi:N-acyl-D-amino-acid deacylase